MRTKFEGAPTSIALEIVATLGPASDTYDIIRALFVAGADVFRLNMSHGTHDDIARRHKLIRQVEVAARAGGGLRGAARLAMPPG